MKRLMLRIIYSRCSYASRKNSGRNTSSLCSRCWSGYRETVKNRSSIVRLTLRGSSRETRTCSRTYWRSKRSSSDALQSSSSMHWPSARRNPKVSWRKSSRRSRTIRTMIHSCRVLSAKPPISLVEWPRCRRSRVETFSQLMWAFTTTIRASARLGRKSRDYVGIRCAQNWRRSVRETLEVSSADRLASRLPGIRTQNACWKKWNKCSRTK